MSTEPDYSIGLELLPSRPRKQRITKDQSEAFTTWLRQHPEYRYLSGQRIANRYERETGILVSRMFALKVRKVFEQELEHEPQPQPQQPQPHIPEHVEEPQEEQPQQDVQEDSEYEYQYETDEDDDE